MLNRRIFNIILGAIPFIGIKKQKQQTEHAKQYLDKVIKYCKEEILNDPTEYCFEFIQDDNTLYIRARLTESKIKEMYLYVGLGRKESRGFLFKSDDISNISDIIEAVIFTSTEFYMVNGMELIFKGIPYIYDGEDTICGLKVFAKPVINSKENICTTIS